MRMRGHMSIDLHTSECVRMHVCAYVRLPPHVRTCEPTTSGRGWWGPYGALLDASTSPAVQCRVGGRARRGWRSASTCSGTTRTRGPRPRRPSRCARPPRGSARGADGGTGGVDRGGGPIALQVPRHGSTRGRRECGNEEGMGCLPGMPLRRRVPGRWCCSRRGCARTASASSPSACRGPGLLSPLWAAHTGAPQRGPSTPGSPSCRSCCPGLEAGVRGEERGSA